MATLILKRGDTNEWDGQITKPGLAGGVKPLPIEPTAQLRFTVKRSKADADSAALIRKTNLAGVPDGVFVDDAPTGRYRVLVGPADTLGLPEGRFPYDVQLKDSTGTFTIDEGTILVEADVTQAA